MDHPDRRVAYFSMEIGLKPEIPTYAGGLGVLAGDTIRSAADLGVPVVAVSLVHRGGYFNQSIDAEGRQHEAPVQWDPDEFFDELSARAAVQIEGRTVLLRAWRFVVVGITGHIVPVYLLDSDLPQNDPKDRDLTSHLYGGEQRYRLKQEVILGIGGVRMLRALGHHSLERYHMNEGHAALLTYELLAQRVAGVGRKPDARDLDAVRRLCVFTTHTPVPAGHDKFPMDLVHEILGDDELLDYEDVFCCDGVLNMTRTALKLSRYVNGVAKRHGEVSRQMFLPYSIDSITNGVHAGTWVSPPIIAMFERHIPGWRDDNFSLRYTMGIPDQELWAAHMDAKALLIDEVNRATHVGMDREVFTICYARRSTAYKRPDMLISDLDRLRAIASKVGPLQIIYSGKAHPRDTQGKELIELVHKAAAALAPAIKLVFLPNYNMAIAAMVTAGGDLWLNTPQPPMEASGTSGMKAALNGVPSLSTLDGWWLEGCIEGVTGWAIGSDSYRAAAPPPASHNGSEPSGGGASGGGASGGEGDAASLYDKLERTILPMYLHERPRYIDVMRNAIALNGSFFNTERMVHEYVLKAYFS